MPAIVPADIARALKYGEPAPSGRSADELHTWGQLDFFDKHGLGYTVEIANRPQTLYGIADSPTGLATWILDHDTRRYALIACVFDGQPGGPTRDDVLDNITLYWLTNKAISSVSVYWENKLTFFDGKNVAIPVAVSVLPARSMQPREVGQSGRIPCLPICNTLDKGSNFAAWEQSELFAIQLRAAFRTLRQSI